LKSANSVCRSRVIGAAGWVAAFLLIAPASPGAARQRQSLDSGWRFHLNELDGNSAIAPPGIPVTQWVWIADDNAPNDAATRAAPGLNTSTWTNVAIGTDVFNGRVGYAWFRSTIVASGLPTQPAAIYFEGVDDNGTVYLNGSLLGQHQGWSEPFSVSPLSPAWIAGGTNVLAVAVQNTGGPGGISAPVLLESASPQQQPPGIPITQWVWLADADATNDAAAMTATNLDTSAWSNAAVGQDVFNGRAGYAWFRASLDALALSARPLSLHFVEVADNAGVYLNGHLIGQHTGDSQAFDLSPLDYAWSSNGPNVLAIAVQNTGGSGGIMGPVLLQSGNSVPPPGNPLTQWVWRNDPNAPSDAATLAATNLNTSAWANAAVGQDVFQGGADAAWFRTALDASATGGRPLALHFLGFGANDSASVYLNGAFLGEYSGACDIPALDSFWSSSGPNVLAVAVENTNGAGGILKPVLLQSGDDIQDLSPTDPDFNDSSWRLVQLPHDYVIEGTFTNTAEAGHASLPLANAWYRQTFPLPSSAAGQSVWIDFDGVYHNSTIWINGHCLGYWHSGYASFRYDITPFAIPGGANLLAVHLDPHVDEGWWYEGAGIYRHVWLNLANPLHVAPSGAFVTANVHGPDSNGNASADLTMTTTVTNASAQAQTFTLVSQVTGPDGLSAGTATTAGTLPPCAATNLIQSLSVAGAHLWSLEMPQLYQLQTSLQQNQQTVDSCATPFGIRSIYYDVNNGFFLNGTRVELKGMCNHQDFAGVGIGIPDNLFYWRVMKLKQMGANAWRCSHNPPAPALLDACDQLGMLVMDENRNLGDATGGYSPTTAQTPYSNFAPLDSMILRDRNHPSVIMWSMCNEESSSGTQAGADIFYAMKQRVLEFDTSRPVTSAMNGGWFGLGITLVEDIEGFNYSSGEYDAFHQAYPSQPLYGSETSSAMADRGEYTNDGVAYLSSFSSPEGAWQPVVERPFIAGSFTWTGFDYKGEPTPYGWPCISSKFGVLDLCGLPKDMFYYYQAWWGDQPLVHILPHWNWSSGQTIGVWCYGNTASIELFLNGVSQGAQTMPACRHLEWSIPYAAGTLLAKGYDANGNTVATDQVATAGVPAALQLKTDRTTVTADDEDLTVVYASVLDAQGRVVPTASNLVTFSVSGPGFVAGVGNGDPASHEPDRSFQRHAFNGWGMGLLGAHTGGQMTLTATSPGLAPATQTFQALSTNNPPAAPAALAALPSPSQVALNWTIAFGATSYNVKRSQVKGGPYATIANYTAVGYSDTNVTGGATCYYVVSAVNSNGESANSIEAGATPGISALPPLIISPPQSFVASSPICSNVPIAFSVLATNGQPLFYQWQEISGGATNIIPGATNSSYTHLTTASDANSSNAFYVVVSNAYGSVTSSVAAMTILQVVTNSPGAVSVQCAITNYFGYSGFFLRPGDSAGVYAASNWNVVPVTPSSALAASGLTVNYLKDTNGTATPVSITACGISDGWHSGSVSGSSLANTRMMNTFWKARTGSPAALGSGLMEVTFANLNSNQIYNAYLYLNDNSANIADISAVAGMTNYTGPEWQMFSDASNFVQSVDTTLGTPDPGNYVELSGLSPNSSNAITICVQWDSSSSGDGVGVCGFQLVPLNPVPPLVWYKADAIGLHNGARVAVWSDSSGGGRNATNGVVAQQPVFVANAMNGLPVVRFLAGYSTFLAFPDVISNDFTIACVFQSAQGLGSGAQYGQGAGLVSGDVAGTANKFASSLNASGQILCGDGSPDNSAVSAIGYNNGAPHVFTFERVQSTGLISLHVDGLFASSVTGVTAALTSPPRLVLGAQQELANFLSGDIAEVRIFGVALTDPNRQYVENALKAKYQIGGSASGLTVPAVPAGLTATPGNGEVGLSWNASSGASSYNIKRASVQGGPYALIAHRVATLHMDLGLAAGNYYYVVSATNAAGQSANSAEAGATVSCQTPPAPAGLAFTAENGQIILAWSPAPPSPGATGYNVLRSTNGGGPFTMLAMNVAATNYTDVTITDKAACYYAVEAVNNCGPGASSAAVAASLAGLNIQPALAAVTNQTILAGRTLQIQNAATDANSPPQLLHYSLALAPPGAVIDSASGLFDWRPTIAQGGATYPVALAVFDNGLPSLGATQNFTVSVLLPAPPAFGAPNWSHGAFQSFILGDSGLDYSILASTNLATWTPIFTTNSPDPPWLFEDSSATNGSQRFYRVRLGP
jgi:beta-galactosidase